jgi:hypothetical protein
MSEREWQPIATAPTKGKFLVWIEGTDLPWPAHTAGDGHLWSNSHGLLNEPDDRGRVLRTNFWLPLPPPPAAV